MKTIIFVLVASIALKASAQFRIVNGQIYRADDPRIWRIFPNLEVCSVLPDGSLKVREAQTVYGNEDVDGIKYGTFGTQQTVSTIYGVPFILLHYSANVALAPGMDIGCVKAMLVPPVTLTTGERSVASANVTYIGSHDYGSASASVDSHDEIDAVTYDCGMPYYPPQPVFTAAQIAAKKQIAESNVVRYVECQASNGDVGCECELGERLMIGDGKFLLQDKSLGQIWLQKAELGGSVEASNYLQNFILTNAAFCVDSNAKQTVVKK